MTTTTLSSPDLPTQAARLATIRDRLDLEIIRNAEGRRELQRSEDEIRKLTNLAYWQLARMWALDAAQH